MTSPLLIVASPTTSPLSTGVPLDLTGQPEWWRCQDCGQRTEDPARWGSTLCRGVVTDVFHDNVDPDGPFPVTVARWAEVECPLCYGNKVRQFVCADDHEEFLGRCQDCPDSGKVGAIVELVEVTGPSHHADECHETHSELLERPAWCSDEAMHDGWHTPTGTVTALPEPIPCERPYEEPMHVVLAAGGGWPASVWAAGEALAARLREVT